VNPPIPPDPVLVRPVRPEDHAAVGALCVAAYRADGQDPDGTGYSARLADVAFRAAEGEVLVAVDAAGTPLGTVTLVRHGSRLSELARPGDVELRMLAVAPPSAGRGVGRTLVRAGLDRAARDGCAAAVISVNAVAERAMRLYRGLGFTRVPDLDWSPVPGVRLLAMRRDLDPPAGHAAG
jgi:ribosomal protein S18 acetylase RimI-like enzyme